MTVLLLLKGGSSGTSNPQSLAGSITPSGVLTQKTTILRGGSATGSGVAAKADTTFRVGSTTGAGNAAKQPATNPLGSATGAGALGKVAQLARGGALWNGTVMRLAQRWAGTPSIAAYNVGDLEIVVRIALDDWTPAVANGMFERDGADPNRWAQFVIVGVTGVMRLRWFPTGSAVSSIIANSTVAPPFADGNRYWLKATLDVDNGAGGWSVQFFWAGDQATEPTTWTQLGTTVTGAGVTTLPSPTATVAMGGNAGGPSLGQYSRAILRNGIAGTVVLDADFTIRTVGQTTFTESSSNAATVTVSSPAAIIAQPGGFLRQAFTSLRAGSSTPAGAPRELVSIARGGSATGSGTASSLKVAILALVGSVTAAGNLVRSTLKRVAGTATGAGTPTKAVTVARTGSVTGSATVRRAVATSYLGAVVATGAVRRAVAVVRQGIATAAGALAAVFHPPAPPDVGPVALHYRETAAFRDRETGVSQHRDTATTRHRDTSVTRYQEQRSAQEELT